MQQFFFTSTHIIALVFILCSAVLWLQRSEGEFSRRVLAMAYAFIGSIYVFRAVTLYFDSPIAPGSSPGMLLMGLFVIITYTLYPVEVISPGYLKWRRILLAYSPFILCLAIYFVSRSMGVQYPEFHSLPEIWGRIGEFNIWFRIVVFLIAITVSLLILVFPHTGRFKNVDTKWVCTYVVLMQFISICFILVTFFEQRLLAVPYQLGSAAIMLYVTYQELFVRLFSLSKPKAQLMQNTTTCEVDEVNTVAVIDAVSEVDEAGDESELAMACEVSETTSVSKSDTSLWEKLLCCMEKEKLWRDPDLSIVEVVKKLQSNRTTIWALIKKNGYSNFNDFVAHYRIEEFCRIIDQGDRSNLIDLFFEVGFRSKNTAYTNFKRIKGVTPGEYVNSSKIEKK